MLKKSSALALALCLLLCSCGVVVTEQEAAIEHNGAYDCSAYPSELADLSLLAEGGSAITRHVGPRDADRMWLGVDGLDTYCDAVGFDLSGEDLTGVKDVDRLNFSTDTVWPDKDKLPEGYDPDKIMELGKDPGLGVRDLHARGITGEGVGVAIIDGTLFTEHEQLKHSLMLYETVHSDELDRASARGTAVASIAVGRDIGVAPGADLYYINCKPDHDSGDGEIMADAILRVLEINKSLPESRKIRVISISDQLDGEAPPIAEAFEQARNAGVFVINCNSESFNPDFHLDAMSRDSYSDPNDPTVYRPAEWEYSSPPKTEWDGTVAVPTTDRSCASVRGEDILEWYMEGREEFAVPWMAGFYALCCQVKPDMTIDEFVAVIRDTATVDLKTKPDSIYSRGRVLDPAVVIAALEG